MTDVLLIEQIEEMANERAYIDLTLDGYRKLLASHEALRRLLQESKHLESELAIALHGLRWCSTRGECCEGCPLSSNNPCLAVSTLLQESVQALLPADMRETEGEG